jgi:hypothetical protein
MIGKGPVDPAKSPTSKMMPMKRMGTSSGGECEDPYKIGTYHINPKVPKPSQKVIDFEKMNSFESEAAESRSKNRSYTAAEDTSDRDTQDYFDRKCRFFVTIVKLLKKGSQTRTDDPGDRHPLSQGN